MKKFPHQQFIEDNGIAIDTLPKMLQKRIKGFEELQEDLEHTTEHDREQLLDKLDLLSLELEEDLEEQFEDQLENNDVEDEEKDESESEVKKVKEDILYNEEVRIVATKPITAELDVITEDRGSATDDKVTPAITFEPISIESEAGTKDSDSIDEVTPTIISEPISVESEVTEETEDSASEDEVIQDIVSETISAKSEATVEAENLAFKANAKPDITSEIISIESKINAEDKDLVSKERAISEIASEVILVKSEVAPAMSSEIIPVELKEAKDLAFEDEDLLNQLYIKKQLKLFPIQLIQKGFQMKLGNRLINVGKYVLYRGKYDTYYTLMLKDK